MTLDEALKKCSSTQYLAREAWINFGSSRKLITSEKRKEKLHLKLNPESMFAEDWEVYDLKDDHD